MAGEGAEFAGDAQHHRLRVRALELDLALAEIGLDAVKRAQEIVIPEGAAEFAVGDGFEPDVFLALDDLLDLAVFHRLQRFGRHLSLFTLRPRLLQRRRAQQAADMIGAEGGLGSWTHTDLIIQFRSSPRKRGPSSRLSWIPASAGTNG